MRHIVNAVLVRDGTVLLARRSPDRKAYAGLWRFPGGHVESGESLQAALIREMREEIGVTPGIHRRIGEIADPQGPAIHHMMLVTDWAGGEPRIMDHEHTSLRWVAIAEAPALDGLALAAYRPLFAQLA